MMIVILMLEYPVLEETSIPLHVLKTQKKIIQYEKRRKDEFADPVLDKNDVDLDFTLMDVTDHTQWANFAILKRIFQK
ncbi:hypothetical protein TNIN_302301 [Trichonephila inaurata madagascariensis]|uniref:Uncharacterized protein n=1 Tax=Trichonephila inaurata madagascariensis TaxID=2747483 RepID=A0A8X6IRG7_9ARAC|nr:hypothetical protein TNIN_302301 [Trichonephila inaurata madagascariensis]